MLNFNSAFMLKLYLMKSVISSKSPLVIAALFFSVLTCYAQQETSDLLVGEWTKTFNGSTITFTITADSKYQVDFVENGSVDVWGSYTISGNKITFSDEGGDYSADVPGTYEFQVDKTSLTFKESDDPLEGRRVLMVGGWSKAEDIEE